MRQRAVHRIVRHPTSSLTGFSLAAAIVLAGTFLPWLRSGSRNRSSYDLLGVLVRLEFAPHGLVTTAVRWWPVVPLLVTAAVVAGWWRWTWLAIAAGASAAVYAGGVAVAVTLGSNDVGIDLGPGPPVCMVGSAGLLVSAVWLALTSATSRGLPTPVATPPADRS